jgi:hypothetical protein
MAAVRIYIDKFKGVVLIEEDHPLAVAQRAKAASSVTRLDGKPLERGADGLVHGERAKSRELLDSEAIPPKIDPARSDDDLILQFSIEAIDRGYSEEAAEKIARGRLRHLRAGGDGYSVAAASLFDLPPEEREVPAVQQYLTELGRKELQDLAKQHEIAANQSSADLVEQLTLKLTTPTAQAGGGSGA